MKQKLPLPNGATLCADRTDNTMRAPLCADRTDNTLRATSCADRTEKNRHATHGGRFAQIFRSHAKHAALSAAIAAVLILFLLAPARYAQACLQGVTLWATAVLPALFPFFVLTGVLTRLGTAQKLANKLSPLTAKIGLPGSAAYCLLISILSGYPAGSRTVADLRAGGAVTEQQARRMSVLCSTSGPMFVIGTVGGAMFRSAAAGGILLAAHLLANIGVCLILYFINRRKHKKTAIQKNFPHSLSADGTKQVCAKPVAPAATTPKNSRGNLKGRPTADSILADSVQSGVIAVLCVGGFIALFCVVGQAFADLKITAALSELFALPLEAANSAAAAEGLVCGLLEATQGCAALAASKAPLALPLAAFLLTFGGASILAQQLAFLKKAGVNSLYFIGVKTIQGIAAFLLCLVFTLLL